MLQELLKEYLGEDAKVEEFLNKMKERKIYTSSEENIDGRYSKLKQDFETLSSKSKESEDLIAQLKKQNGDNETLQSQVKAYEEKIQELEAENARLEIDNTLKFELLAKGAKSNDIDYLIYRAKQGDTELKLDKDGKIKGLDDLIDGLKKSCASNFEEAKKKQVDVKELPNEDPTKDTMTKEEFLKKPYSERAQFAADNPEAFQEMMNK